MSLLTAAGGWQPCAGPWQSDPDFIELAHRAAPWSPIPRRHESGVAAWQGARVCPRCARATYWDEVRVPAGAGAACPDCGALRVWEHDIISGAGRLTCSCPTVPPTPLALSAVAPLRPQPPADVPMPQLRTEPVHASDSEPESRVAVGEPPELAQTAWQRAGPPPGAVGATNSWLYVIVNSLLGHLRRTSH